MNGLGQQWLRITSQGKAELSPGFDLDEGDNREAVILANQELIRPIEYRRAAPGLLPFSSAWFDELEQKRYQRQGWWLPHALEFDRHPGESVLLLGAGLGNDAIRYARNGARPLIAVYPQDPVARLDQNLSRYSWPIGIIHLDDEMPWPFPSASLDVICWNALHEPWQLQPSRLMEVYRLLKPGGKLICLTPAYYDVAYWQDLLLPFQRVYWTRPPDPTTAPKLTSRQLRHMLNGFSEITITRRHLRRSELPHPWRLLPLSLLERLIGRVYVVKAVKPIAPGNRTT
jgi:SAM-dependent methyltransferase